MHSSTGFCLIVPREDDMVRLYIPLDETERYLDPVTKRVNIAAVNPDDLLDVSRIQRYTLRLRRLTLVSRSPSVHSNPIT